MTWQSHLSQFVQNTEDFMQSLSAPVVLFAALLGAMVLIVKVTHKAFVKARTFMSRVDALVDLADYQLNPNGGESLMDVVTQARDMATDAKTEAEKAKTLAAESHDRIEVMADQLEQYLAVPCNRRGDDLPPVADDEAGT